MKLLVCDDDISTIDVIQSQLDCGELGISRILRAYNGEMAERIVDEERPDLILCDIDMPIHNGIDVMKYVYEKAPGTEFSFLTCYEKFEYAQLAVNYGVTSYLTKPFDLEDVRICIQKMVANAVKKHMKQSVYKTAIPRNVRLSEAPSHGMPVLRYDRSSRGAEAYRELAREFVARNSKGGG